MTLRHWQIRIHVAHSRYFSMQSPKRKVTKFQFPTKFIPGGACLFQFTISYDWFSWYAMCRTKPGPQHRFLGNIPPQHHVAWTVYIALTHWGRGTHICVSKLTIIVQIMACRLAGAKPLSEPTMEYFSRTIGSKLQWNINRNYFFHSRKYIWKCRLKNGGHSVSIVEEFHVHTRLKLAVDMQQHYLATYLTEDGNQQICFRHTFI